MAEISAENRTTYTYAALVRPDDDSDQTGRLQFRPPGRAPLQRVVSPAAVKRSRIFDRIKSAPGNEIALDASWKQAVEWLDAAESDDKTLPHLSAIELASVLKAADLMKDMDTLDEVCTANHQRALQARLQARLQASPGDSGQHAHLPGAPSHGSPPASAAGSSPRLIRPPSSGAPSENGKLSLLQRVLVVVARAVSAAVRAVQRAAVYVPALIAGAGSSAPALSEAPRHWEDGAVPWLVQVLEKIQWDIALKLMPVRAGANIDGILGDEPPIDVAEYVRRPVIGAIMTHAGARALYVGNASHADTRDHESLYAASSSELDMAIAFLFNPEPKGFTLQVKDNPSDRVVHAPRTTRSVGRYLTVHRATSRDYPYGGGATQFLRVIVHADPAKCALWQFVEVNGKTLLQVQANFDPAGKETVRWYLADPGEASIRDETSSYLAVTPNVKAAMPVAPAVARRADA